MTNTPSEPEDPWGPTAAPPWSPERATPWQPTQPPPFGSGPAVPRSAGRAGFRPRMRPSGSVAGRPVGRRAQLGSAPRGRAGLWLAVGSVVFALLVAPLGIALALGAVVNGIRNRRLARASGESTSTATTALALGVVGLVLGAIMVTTLVVFRSELNAYTDCLSSGKNQATCGDQLRDAIMHKLGMD